MPRRPTVVAARPGATRRLGVDAIVGAAIDLADADGLEALSMRRLATVLGVDPMSIYHHVRDKAELLDAMADAIVAQIVLPAADPAADWRDRLRDLAHSARATVTRHPWSAALLSTRTRPGPAMLAHVDRVLGILRSGGFTVELAHHALHVLGGRILGFDQGLFDDAPPPDADPALVAAQARAWAPTLPHVAELALAAGHDGVLGPCDDDEEFAFGLDLILDGLERRRS